MHLSDSAVLANPLPQTLFNLVKETEPHKHSFMTSLAKSVYITFCIFASLYNLASRIEIHKCSVNSGFV